MIGAGIAGLSAAWLLSEKHRVTVYDKGDHAGGHANTLTVPMGRGGAPLDVDTGFIVFNDRNYPNLMALFDHLGVPSTPSDMSFAVSLDGGRFEFAGAAARQLFAQRRNLLRPGFWRMLRDIDRFHRDARLAVTGVIPADSTLRDFLGPDRIDRPFVHHYLLPMTAAIWSTPPDRMLDYPARPLLRFLHNHGLLALRDRPQWYTVTGGSARYVDRLTAGFRDRIRLNTAVESVTRAGSGVLVQDRQGGAAHYDEVILACHADEALSILRDADAAERRVLGAFRYQPNVAILHRDPDLMPRRRRAWASWNHLATSAGRDACRPDQNGSGGNGMKSVCVTYWMNRLQPLDTDHDLFVTLNPPRPPREGTILRTVPYAHPLFDHSTERMRQVIWNLQGERGIWFCGSYLGDGFHEDGIQAGLAVAEALGGVRRPWSVDDESGRLRLPAGWPALVNARGGRPARDVPSVAKARG